MRIASAFASFAQWLADRGLFYFRRARIVRYDLTEEDDEGRRTGVDVREGSSEDLRHFAAVQNRKATDWLDKRARGAVCLIACSGGTRMGFLWITRSAEVMTEVDHVLDVSRDEQGAYLFDGYVLPSYRGRGVLRSLLKAAKCWAHRQGLTRLYAAFARDNHASEHALRKDGFIMIIGDVGILRLLHREWKWIRLRRATPRIDVLNASDAAQRVPRVT